jgi:hypothetical protein
MLGQKHRSTTTLVSMVDVFKFDGRHRERDRLDASVKVGVKMNNCVGLGNAFFGILLQSHSAPSYAEDDTRSA